MRRHAPRVPSRCAARACLAGALLLVAATTATCTKDVGDGLVGQVRPEPTSATEALVGLDFGFAPSLPLRELAVAGASLPRSGARDLTIAFLAFTTAAPADDGPGRRIDRHLPPPTDTLGLDDVFLCAMVNTERVIAGQAVPTAFTQGIAPIMRDARCGRCHSYHYPDGWRVNGHQVPMPPGSNENCGECHKPQDILIAGKSPASIVWLAPDPGQTRQQDFRGKTDMQLFDLVLDSPGNDPKAHLQNDDKILWAIGHGRVPFRGAAAGGPVPIDPQQWQNLVEGWALGAEGALPMAFSTTDAVKDVVLASRHATANRAGNGASSQPSLAFAANPNYDPDDPTAASLGTVHVAFVSSATDLTAVATTNRNVFRASFQVWLVGTHAIELRHDRTTLVSATTTGGSANADSGAPVLDASGDLCAFESAATDLVDGYVPDPTAARTNVYLRNIQGGTSALVSHRLAAASQSGDGDSVAPRISATGGVVAFESDATDLVSRDRNGVRDVFVARTLGTPVVQRASVRTGGGEATGGRSSHAAVFRDPGTEDVWVAFESTADFGSGSGKTAVMLHRPSSGVTLAVGKGASGRQPAFTADGARMLFLSDAALDSLREDRNGRDDLIGLDFAGFRRDGRQVFARSSLAASGGDADAPVGNHATGGFRRQDGTFATDELLAFTTAATNLGRSPNSDVVVDFAVDRSIPRVVAQFRSEVTRGVATPGRPFAVRFTDLSNNAASWSWDFGDGGSATEQSPTHEYMMPGTYPVTLTVEGAVGSATETKPGFVQVLSQPRTWDAIYGDNLLVSTCATAGCHQNSAGSSTFSMTTAATAYNNMVGTAIPPVGVNSVTGCAPTKRVKPNDSANSVLVFAISDPHQCTSFRMGALSPQAVHDIVDWIDNGVPRGP